MEYRPAGTIIVATANLSAFSIMAITLTDSAAQQISKYLASQNDAIGLRFGIKNAGCSGFAYTVDVGKVVNDNDDVFEVQGVKLIVANEHLSEVDGTQIDYISDGFSSTFKFNNPNVVDECGCGESFSTKPV